MARLAVLTSVLVVCLATTIMAEDNSSPDSWLQLKMALQRKNREQAARNILSNMLMNVLRQKMGGEGTDDNGSGLSKKSHVWRSIGLPIQTRFAAFGSKLMPSQEGGDHGSTLLRYGRSATSN